ncbi:uncharacterized protein At4g06598-like [Rutidosis leptorrhynchoides]|uniref:uncharacterized protein At4g06598-like n=1 Tax=Rutidosis leptorrhynchoides TaxID=125765 RepID=UPI003A98ED1D
MANSKGSATTRNMMYNGRNSLLPPKCPFPTSYGADYISNAAIGPKVTPKDRNGNSLHQRASSESLLIEEQPSWLDELLNEPESPVQRGHRRSSSDSFTYLEAANAVKNEHQIRNLTTVNPSWANQDLLYKDARNMPFYGEQNSVINNRARAQNAHSSGMASSVDNLGLRRSVSLGATQDLNGIGSVTEKKEAADAGPQRSGDARTQDANPSFERNDSLNNMSETDTKRAKQQFAQRSRVRKLQYIAELERSVQALRAEGCEVSAEMEFLNQQSLILGMENKALKQRLDNLAQEQLIKRLEHEVLEREFGRLRALYQQQQPPPPPQQPPQSHRRTASRDRLDFQFSNLSLKNKDSSPVRDPVSSQPRT